METQKLFLQSCEDESEQRFSIIDGFHDHAKGVQKRSENVRSEMTLYPRFDLIDEKMNCKLFTVTVLAPLCHCQLLIEYKNGRSN